MEETEIEISTEKTFALQAGEKFALGFIGGVAAALGGIVITRLNAKLEARQSKTETVIDVVDNNEE